MQETIILCQALSGKGSLSQHRAAKGGYGGAHHPRACWPQQSTGLQPSTQPSAHTSALTNTGSARWNKEIKETVGARFRSLDEFLGEELACVANLLLLKVGGHFG